jgi:DNA end-binding protein Ku
MLTLAVHIIESKADDFDLSTFVDRYEVALVELLKTKQAGISPKPVAAPGRRAAHRQSSWMRSAAALKQSNQKSRPRNR